MVDRSDIAAIDLVLQDYALSRTGAPSEVSAGTLNLNFKVPTDQGLILARRYRAELDRDHIQREHEVTRWVADRGIPAIAPRAHPDGETVVNLDGRLWSLFLWVDAHVPTRGAMTPGAAHAVGAIHGQIQRALAEHPESTGSTLKALSGRVAWDTAASIERLELLGRRASEATVPDGLVEAMSFQRQVLETEAPRPFAEFEWLPCQLLHGDFHDQQVLLNADETVAGIVDWELTQVASRVWELLRSLAFSRVLETDLLEHYVRGFSRYVSLAEDECRAGVEFWWQNRLHGSWVYGAYLFDGNERVVELFEETDRHLRRFADERWRAQIADRLVQARV